tara:strand:- start:875 stop:1084 length:210 start_codon:yes stop_codon:yes gene_type:complete
MCLRPPRPPKLPDPRPTAPAPEKRAQNVVVGKGKKKSSALPQDTMRRRGASPLRIRRASGRSYGGNLNV